MVKIFDAQLRHARRFADVLQQAESDFEQGGRVADEAVTRYRDAQAQIVAAQVWASANAPSSDVVSDVCWSYAAASSFGTSGDSLLELHIPLQTRRTWFEAGLQAARRQNDRRREGLCLYSLGCIASLDRSDQALGLLETARHLFAREGDEVHGAITVLAIAGIWAGEGQIAESLGYCTEAASIFHRHGSPWEGNALAQLARVQDSLGNKSAALAAFQQAVRFFEGKGDNGRLASALVQLGGHLVHSGAIENGRDVLLRAVSILETIEGRRPGFFTTSLADAGLRLVTAGDESGLRLIQTDVSYFHERGHDTGEGYSLVSLGTAQLVLKRYDVARRSLRNAEHIFERLGDDTGRGLALHQRARVELASDRPAKALGLAQKASRIFGRVEQQTNCAFAQRTTSRALLVLGKREESLDMAKQSLATLEHFGHTDAASLRTFVEKLESSPKTSAET